MHTDAHFVTGSAHQTSGKPCQDYADASVLNGGAFAIVSDGCSTGGRTDIGARAVVLSTAQAIRHHWNTTKNPLRDGAPQEIAVQQRLVMAAAQATLGCGQSDMLATCLYTYLSPQGGFVQLQGDGVVAWQTTDSMIEMVRFDWENSAPAYPVYSDDNFAQFIAFHGNDIDGIKLTSERWRHSEKDGFMQLTSRQYTLGEGTRAVTLPLQADGLRCAAVFSDGVTQVENIDWKDAVVNLLAFKTTAGDFAKRRMIRFVKDASKRGKGPIDDLAYAVVMLDSEEGS